MNDSLITLQQIGFTMLVIAWVMSFITSYLKGKLYLSWQFSLVAGLGFGVLAYDFFATNKIYIFVLNALMTILALYFTYKSAKYEYGLLKKKEEKVKAMEESLEKNGKTKVN